MSKITMIKDWCDVLEKDKKLELLIQLYPRHGDVELYIRSTEHKLKDSMRKHYLSALARVHSVEPTYDKLSDTQLKYMVSYDSVSDKLCGSMHKKLTTLTLLYPSDRVKKSRDRFANM